MWRPTPRWLLPLLGLILALGGCATRVSTIETQHLLRDELFARSARVFDAQALFELSPEMLDYPVSYTHLDVYKRQGHHRGLRLAVRTFEAFGGHGHKGHLGLVLQALLDALYSNSDLRLAYDGSQMCIRDSEYRDPPASATLINNAGVISELAPLSEGESADLARALRVGLEAPMLLTSAFLHATAGLSLIHI